MWQQIIAFFQSIGIFLISLFVGLGWIPNKLTAEPVVFAVGAEYQIVWQTSQPSAAWVKVGDEIFTDNAAGNLRWDETIHKVSVPMDRLDNARGYEIHYQHVIQRDAYYAGKKGKELSKAYAFRPVDESDGLQIYNISDNHSSLHPAAEIASYWGDKLDLLILNGDISNDLTQKSQLTDAIQLGSAVTHGARPVLYARGNHETRGPLATSYDRYVGVPGPDQYYYTTRLGSLWVAVYDAGEDKVDSHEEYGGMADYAAYRNKEIAWFDEVLNNAQTEFDANGIKYRLLVSHIPLGEVKKSEIYAYNDAHDKWVTQANQMKIDLALSGHWHRLGYFPANTFDRPAPVQNYPLIVGAQPSNNYNATAVEFKNDGSIAAWFTDSNHAMKETMQVREASAES